MVPKTAFSWGLGSGRAGENECPEDQAVRTS